jgi:hypothetical protein
MNDIKVGTVIENRMQYKIVARCAGFIGVAVNHHPKYGEQWSHADFEYRPTVSAAADDVLALAPRQTYIEIVNQVPEAIVLANGANMSPRWLSTASKLSWHEAEQVTIVEVEA